MKTHEQIAAMVQIAMLTAIISVLSIISIPMPTNVPLTLQTFAIALAGYSGGIRKGLPAVGIYLILGAVGVPVFSGMKGGFSVLLGYTGGFLWGFLLMALLCGIGREKGKIPCILLGTAGLALCHLCGVLQYTIVAGTPFLQSFLLVSAPYLIKDVLSVLGGCLAAAAVRKGLLRAGIAA